MKERFGVFRGAWGKLAKTPLWRCQEISSYLAEARPGGYTYPMGYLSRGLFPMGTNIAQRLLGVVWG